MNRIFIYMILAFLFCSSCRKDTDVVKGEQENITPEKGSIKGFYLLNEGNMGMNRASIDFCDLHNGVYNRNIYSQINPDATRELGDVGNDIKIYGSKMYVVLNMSDKVEVLDAFTAKRIGQINISNCRNITFYNGKIYVSAYTGIVNNPSSPNGIVAEVDTSSFKILRETSVGRQPEDMTVVGNKLYVANSGGYSPSNYDRTVSVIDLETFTEIKKIDVAINLHRIQKDNYGDLYVTSRGNYYTTRSKLFIIDTYNDRVKDSFDIAAGNIVIQGDSAYVYSAGWSYIDNKNQISYALIDVKNEEVLSNKFINDATVESIRLPYGLAINPYSHDIYVTDAGDYLTPGTLYCFDKNGYKKWSVRTGDIPGHFTFLWHNN